MWALVLAITSFVLCPLVAAIVALVLAGSAARSIRSSGGARTGGGLVTAARIIGWLNVALSVVSLALLAVFADDIGEALGRLFDRQEVETLTVGQCFDDPDVGSHPAEVEVLVVDCATTHDGEVFARLADPAPPGTPWPGQKEASAAASLACSQAFPGYVGTAYESSVYDYAVYTASAAEWTAGQRTFACALVDPDGATLVGSGRGSRR